MIDYRVDYLIKAKLQGIDTIRRYNNVSAAVSTGSMYLIQQLTKSCSIYGKCFHLYVRKREIN